jgi:RHS repeat-associated protein
MTTLPKFTGRLPAGLTTAALAQSSGYSYDAIGNVLSRSQSYASLPANNYGENFCYDKLNRVTSSAGCSATQFSYSDDGNLTSKGGTTGNIGTITYGTTARTNNAGPHAVASANGKTYFYDANGNVTSTTGGSTSSVDYMPFNLPRSITGSNANISGLTSASVLTYNYDADHTRVSEQVASGPNAGSSTIYVGPGFFEVANNANGTKEYRHYIGGPDGTIGIRTVAVDASNNVLTSAAGQGQTTRYWFKDHLGSPASEYDAGAVNLTPLGFDTWGLRRKNTSANSFTQSLTTADLASYQSPRGYTGHEHLDDVGLIHMNGRIYDPMIGRFMQPDPVISEPYNSQNFNRYAYVLNNPLMYTDPSGYSTWTEVRRPVAAIVVAVITYNVVGAYAAAYAFEGTITVQTAQLITTAASGFASGGVGGGNIESAIAGAFQAVALFGVGEALGHTDAGFFKGNHAVRIVAHAAVGCAAAGVQGGSCGQGAASAGFAAFAGPIIEAVPTYEGQVVAHAVAGGLGSLVAGGKFGNGAITGAFGYIYNRAAGGSANEVNNEDYWTSCTRATASCAALRAHASGELGLVPVVDMLVGGRGAFQMGKSIVEYGWNSVRGIEGFMNPAMIRLSQDTVSSTFINGMSISETAAGLASGAIKAGSIPPIRLTMRDGMFFTLDNRRLIAYNLAQVPVPYRMATFQEVGLANLYSKFSTVNKGTFAAVKGMQ